MIKKNLSYCRLKYWELYVKQINNKIVKIYLFLFQTKLMQHGSSKKCLAISENKQKLLMEECNPLAPQQQWKFDNYDPSKL